jgi:hypothetical protein
MYKESREKLVEKNIYWREEYTDKTQFLKDQFNEVVGPGSYFRFEGRAPNSDQYYCIVGPAKVHAPKAKFFAGVRKLPATYSAGGKYFDSLDAAATYAKDTWGVPTPHNLFPYTSRQLLGISQKVHDWKEKHEQEQEREDKKEQKKKDRKSRREKRKQKRDKKDLEAFNIDVLIKEAMPMKKELRTGYVWHTYEAIVSKKIKNFEDLIKENPSFIGALNEIKDEKRRRYAIYSRKYGFEPEKMRKMFRVYVGYSRHHGLYAIYVGPYLMSPGSFKAFYEGLHNAGLLPKDMYNAEGKINYGKDISDDVLRTVLAGNSAGLKKLAGLYFSDKSGKFQTFQKPYHVPSHDKGWRDIDGHVKAQNLDRFNDFDEVDNVTQVQSLKEHGTPLAQKMGLDDYSYIFNYKASYRVTERAEGKGGFFPKQQYPPTKPNGDSMGYGPHLPANYRDDPLCQIYSLSNYEEAKTNNMIVSGSGTRIFLNRNGLNKTIINTVASYPQYNERLMEYLRNSPSAGQKLKPAIRPHVTRNLSSFLYFLTGVGHMDNEGIRAVNAHFSQGIRGSAEATNNGTLNLDDVRTYTSKKGVVTDNAKCGFDKHRKICLEMMKFYKEAIQEDEGVIRLSGANSIDEDTARVLVKKGYKKLSDVKNINDEDFMAMRIPPITIQAIRVELNGMGENVDELSIEKEDLLWASHKNLVEISGLFGLRSQKPTVNPYITTEDKQINHLRNISSIDINTARILIRNGKTTLSKVKLTPQNQLVAMGINEVIVTEFKAELTKMSKDVLKKIGIGKLKNPGSFMNPKVALTNSPLLMTAKAKNGMRLLSEIANFMAKQNINFLSNENAEVVAAYLNSGGDANPEWHTSKKGKKTLERPIARRINHIVEDENGNGERRVYFSRDNVIPLMAKVLNNIVLADVINFVIANNVEEPSKYVTEAVVSHLEEQGHKDYFTPDNVNGIINDAIYRVKNDKTKIFGLNVKSIAEDIGRKTVLMEEIYKQERISRKRWESLDEQGAHDVAEEEESSTLNLIWNEVCPNCNAKDDQVNVVKENNKISATCNACNTQFKPRFETFDTHDSFHEVFMQIRDIIEAMSYARIEMSERLTDPVTGASLISINEKGLADIKRINRIFYNAPKDNMRSSDLEDIFEKMSEEEKNKYRTLRSDIEMAQWLLGPLNRINMDQLSISEYEYQLNISAEIDEAMNEQIANDDPIDDEEAKKRLEEDEKIENDEERGEEEDKENKEDAIVAIDPEVEPIANPQEIMEQPLNPPNQPPNQPQQNIDDLFNDNEEEEEGFGFMFDEKDGKDEVKASKEIINNLLKLSQELDDEGKENESVELLRLAKKFSGNIRKGK